MVKRFGFLIKKNIFWKKLLKQIAKAISRHPLPFAKYNKKGVSEDFVTENFKELGWSCFRPYLDIGVDLVARKEVCPKNHTEWDTIEKQAQCSECGSTLITITRFIQIKTRETTLFKRKIKYILSI